MQKILNKITIIALQRFISKYKGSNKMHYNSPLTYANTRTYTNNNNRTDTQSLGIVLGVGTGVLAKKAFKPIHKHVSNSVIKDGRLSDKEANILKQCADDVLIKTGLKDKGAGIFRANEIKLPEGAKVLKIKCSDIKYDANDQNIINTIIKRQNKLPKSKNPLKYLNPFKPFKDVYNNRCFNLGYKSIKAGCNAMSMPDIKMIIAPEKSMQQSLFHEIGHVLNHQNSALKTLRKIGQHSKLALIAIALISVLNPRSTKEKQKKNDSFGQKAADFVKRNAGKLALLTFIPALVEEANASIKGGKIAENLFKEGKISNEILSKIKNTHNKGFMTYVVSAVAAFTAVKSAIFVKDKTQEALEKHRAIKTFQG